MVSFVRSTLAEQAYEQLQDRIVSGLLPAGQRLRPDELADSLSISPTPVKEALALLERDGLVEGSSRRATIVRRFTPSDIHEIYVARILLEVSTAEIGLKACRADRGFVSQLEGIFTRHISNVEKQTTEGLRKAIRLDRDFHALIVGLARNRTLERWHATLLLQTQTIRNYPLARYDFERTRREHGAIVDAFTDGELDSVLDALRRHLEASRDEFLSRRPDELPVRP
jgi:DNA-binding GntR family transcriptional regulator